MRYAHDRLHPYEAGSSFQRMGGTHERFQPIVCYRAFLQRQNALSQYFPLLRDLGAKEVQHGKVAFILIVSHRYLMLLSSWEVSNASSRQPMLLSPSLITPFM